MLPPWFRIVVAERDTAMAVVSRWQFPGEIKKSGREIDMWQCCDFVETEVTRGKHFFLLNSVFDLSTISNFLYFFSFVINSIYIFANYIKYRKQVKYAI